MNQETENKKQEAWQLCYVSCFHLFCILYSFKQWSVIIKYFYSLIITIKAKPSETFNSQLFKKPFTVFTVKGFNFSLLQLKQLNSQLLQLKQEPVLLQVLLQLQLYQILQPFELLTLIHLLMRLLKYLLKHLQMYPQMYLLLKVLLKQEPLLLALLQKELLQ